MQLCPKGSLAEKADFDGTLGHFAGSTAALRPMCFYERTPRRIEQGRTVRVKGADTALTLPELPPAAGLGAPAMAMRALAPTLGGLHHQTQHRIGHIRERVIIGIHYRQP